MYIGVYLQHELQVYNMYTCTHSIAMAVWSMMKLATTLSLQCYLKYLLRSIAASFPGSSQAFHYFTEKLRKSVAAEASHQDGAASILQRLAYYQVYNNMYWQHCYSSIVVWSMKKRYTTLRFAVSFDSCGNHLSRWYLYDYWGSQECSLVPRLFTSLSHIIRPKAHAASIL